MAIELIVKSKKLAEAVESLYDAARNQGIPNGGWAILGQVWLTNDHTGARVKMTSLPKHFADEISGVLLRASVHADRKRRRETKARTKR